MERFLKDARAFSIPHESWYSDISVKPLEPFPYIMVGFYYDNNGTEGEFQIVWDNIGIRLQAYNDSWEALSHMPELIMLMADISKNENVPTIREFAELLKQLGYKDITDRVKL